jgi:glycosyltransferase involved in cell wall biosynthesis
MSPEKTRRMQTTRNQTNSKRFLVAILTKNDESQIAPCLESAKGLDADFLVVDSGSTDKTVEIARGLGAEVAFYEFVTEARSRNWILKTWGPRYEWVVFIDSDERLTPELRDEIAALPSPYSGPKGYSMRRLMFFLGKELRYGGHQDVWVLHVLHPPAARVVEQTRTLEYVRVDGPVGKLCHPLIHENRKGLSDWTLKHNFYAQREAEDRVERRRRKEPVTEGRLKAFIHDRILTAIPPFFLPVLFFVYRYVFRLGFLDGRVGLIYYLLHDLWYPFLVAAKVDEIKKKQKR